MSNRSTYQFPFASLPSLRIALLLIVGIVLGSVFEKYISWTGSLYIFLGLFFLWSISEYQRGLHFSILKTTFSITLYFALIIVFGMGLYTIEQERKAAVFEKAEPLQLYEWESVIIEGAVRVHGVSQSGREIYEIEAQRTLFDEHADWPHRYRIRVYGNDNISQRITAGMQIKAEVRLYAFPEVRNPHDFDYGAWLISRKIVAHGELQNVISKTEENLRDGKKPARMFRIILNHYLPKNKPHLRKH